jgi:hypothetical protein
MIRASDVTVLIPTIPGRETLLELALDSVRNQQAPPGDIVVQLDTEREGAATTRNKALERVTTDWVAFLDDDDEFKPNHLRVLVKAANRTGADMVFSYPEIIGGRDPLACCDDNGKLVAEPINIPFGPKQALWLRRVGNFVPVTYLVRTATIRKAGGFPQPYSMRVPFSGECEDYLALIRMLDAGARFYHACGIKTWRYSIRPAESGAKGNTGGRGADRLHELG